MFSKWSLPLAGVAAISVLFLSAGAGQAQHSGGGHGGGHSSGSGGHGGGGYQSGGGYHNGGGYHDGYHGGGYHDGYHGGGYYGGYRGGIGIGIGLGGYSGGYPGYYNSGYYSNSYYAPNYYVAPSYYSAPAYYPPATTYVPSVNLQTPSVIRNADFERPVPQVAGNASLVEVNVPPNAEVWFDDLKTKQTGDTRTFKSPELEPGKTYLYDVRARWVENGDEVTRSRTVRVQAGRAVRVDFASK